MNRRNLFLALSLALSLAGLVALETFSRRIGATIERDGRNFLAADFRIQAWRPFDEKVLRAVSDEARDGRTIQRTDFVSTAELPGGDALTVNVAAIAGPYPFYGPWSTEPTELHIADLASAPLVIADGSLKARGLKPGDTLRLGKLQFKLAGFLVEEPQTVASAFSTGPRLIIHERWANETGLLGPGSRAFHQLLVKSPLTAAAFQKKFRAVVTDPHWRLITPDKANRQASTVLDRMRGFLSFVLLSGLFLGGAGVFMIFRSRYLADLPNSLTLRCLGMKSNRIVGRALRESFWIALLSWIPGSVVGVLLEHFVAGYARVKLNVALADASPWLAVGLALGIALAITALAVLVPLREVLRVPVQLAFRQSEAQTAGLNARDAFTLSAASVLITLAVARSLKLALIFLGSLAGTVAALALVAWVLARALDKLRPRGFVSRQAVLSLTRQAGPSLLLVVTTGLGVFFLGTVLFLGHALRKQIDFSNRIGVPNLFLIGITDADKAGLVAQNPGANFIPVTQMRLVEIKGQPITEKTPDAEGEEPEGEQFYKTREYFVTRRNEVSEGERITDGASLFGPARAGLVRVSLERRFAEALRLRVGDALKVELAGVVLPAVVTSLRKVDWFNLRPNFFVVLCDDDVVDAPFNYVGLLRVPVDEISARQREITRRYPSVTAMDGDSIAKRLLKLLDQLSLSIYSVGLFTLGSCAFVFVGLLLSRRRQKLRELALFKCLGVRSLTLHALLAWEFAVSGFVASLTATSAALVTVACVCQFFLDVPLETPPIALVSGLLFGLPALTSVGGWLVMRGLLQEPALTLFRAVEET